MKCARCNNSADYELRDITNGEKEPLCEVHFLEEQRSVEGGDLYKKALEILAKPISCTEMTMSELAALSREGRFEGDK